MNANDKIKADLQRACDAANEKADNLLIMKSSLGRGSPAMSRRLGRECLKWRRRAKELRDRIREIEREELEALDKTK